MVAEEVELSEEVEVLEEADLPVVDEVPEEVDLLVVDEVLVAVVDEEVVWEQMDYMLKLGMDYPQLEEVCCKHQMQIILLLQMLY